MSKPKPVKPFFKINFEDLEIAESFFENEKHFSEFLLAVSYYYRGKEYTIKQKFVQRYFNTYKKTMDFIIDSKKTGSDGGKQRVENQKIKEQTLEGVVEVPVEPNNKLLNSNNKEESINNKTNTKLEINTFPDGWFKIWEEWLSYKKIIKKNYKTDISEKTAFNKLLKTSKNNKDLAVKIINQSIENDWSGFFELKNKPHTDKSGILNFEKKKKSKRNSKRNERY